MFDTRLRACTLVPALLLMLASCGSNESAGPVTSLMPTESTSPSPTPSPTTPTSAAAVAYTDDGDLYHYDVRTDRVTRLTTDGAKRSEVSPRFTDAATVAFAAGRSIIEIDVAGKVEREIHRAAGNVQVLAWSPDRTTLAYLYDRGDQGVAMTLHVTNLETDATADVRNFKPWLGRGGGEDDEVSLQYSPDGKLLLVVLTPLDTVSKETLFVMKPDGKDAVPPRFGTFGRWSLDSGTAYYRDYQAPRAWHTLNVSTGAVGALGMAANTHRPALSWDGTMLAYDESEQAAIFVFDLASGRERKLAGGRIGPIWLSADALAATDVGDCTPGTDCEGAWVHKHTASRIAVADGKTAPLRLASTVYQVDVLGA